MTSFWPLALALSAIICNEITAAALPLQIPLQKRPVVLWHGMGDTYDSAGMKGVAEVINSVHKGIFVHSVYLDESSSEDQKKSLWGSVNEEIDSVCDQLAQIPELKDGFDAIGFSQGGLFLRAYIERCNSPPVKQLITYGSPHNGVADMPPCSSGDWLCRQRNWLMKTQLWSSYVQSHIVAAQYFRDPEKYEDYLENSMFLADINNERQLKNTTYGQNLSASLERLVLALFTEDDMVVPKESAWMQEVNRTTGQVTPLQERDIYKDDWIGLKALGESGLIDYLEVQGVHMQISDEEIKYVAKKYLGSVKMPQFVNQIADVLD